MKRRLRYATMKLYMLDIWLRCLHKISTVNKSVFNQSFNIEGIQMGFVCCVSVIEKLLTMLVDREFRPWRRHLFSRCMSDVDTWRGESSRCSLGLFYNFYMFISA